MPVCVKIMNYEILKPVDVDWDTLGKILRDTQHAVWKTKNRTVQMLWDLENAKYSYEQRFNEKFRFSDLGIGVKDPASDIYRICTNDFPFVYSYILNVAVREAQQRFKSMLSDILKGNVSLPSFKRDTPIPVRAKQMKLYQEDKEYFAQIGLLSRNYAKENNLPTRFTVKLIAKGGAKAIIDRLLSGEYKLRDSRILRRGKKWFLSLTYRFESEPAELDENNIMGIDLGDNNLATIAFNNSIDRYFIPNDEIKEFNKRIRQRRKALLMQGKFCGEGRIGHGIKTRIKPIKKLSGKIANFRNTTNHKYAKYIVNLAVKHGCGVIQMEDLTGVKRDREKQLEDWTYYDLQQKIEYKAKERGINVVYVKPAYTSQRCSQCGHIAKENRKSQSEFECTNCGFKTHADYNAARNIATKDIEKLIEIELKREKISA